MATAVQITCVIRNYDQSSDTVSVELTGLGNIGEWMDGIKILNPINRGALASGVGGVLSAPDLARLCEAVLISITPASGAVVQGSGSGTPKNQSGMVQVQTNGSGSGGPVTITFPVAYTTAPTLTCTAQSPAMGSPATVQINSVGTGSASVSVTAGGMPYGITNVAWNAQGT